jgi:hypothetical protein
MTPPCLTPRTHILPFLICNAHIRVYTVQVTTTMSRINAMNVPVFPSETCDTTTPVGDQLERERNRFARIPTLQIMLAIDWSQTRHMSLFPLALSDTQVTAPARVTLHNSPSHHPIFQSVIRHYNSSTIPHTTLSYTIIVVKTESLDPTIKPQAGELGSH